MSDQTTITFIRADKTDKTLDSLYSFFPAARKMILRNGGTGQDAEDIFQEALIVFCRRIEDPDFQLTSKPSTYLFSVCRFLWKDELKKGVESSAAIRRPLAYPQKLKKPLSAKRWKKRTVRGWPKGRLCNWVSDAGNSWYCFITAG
jgi:DNA-directed RNA polymerase specialized sigma24 family protein